MADTAIVDAILACAQQFLLYMMPVIALMAGITFIVSWLMSITIGLGKRAFRG